MGLSMLQLVSTNALALLAGSTQAAHAHSMAFDLDESTLLRESACTTSLRMPPTAPGCGLSTSNDSATGDGLASHPVSLNLGRTKQRTASDVLTDLLDVDGIRIVAARRLWNQPDILALRHDFASYRVFDLYCAAGIDRATYLDSRALHPSSALAARRHRLVNMLAEAGASWRLSTQLNVETGIRWIDVTGDARLMRTDAGWVSGDPVALTLSLVWNGR